MTKYYNIDSIQEIWHYSTKKHNGQKYGGFNQGEEVEYINHIGSISFEIISASFSEPDMNIDLALKCAILHDTIEDTGSSFSEIEEKFGNDIAQGVLALTKNESISDKKEKMIDSLKRIKEQPKEIWCVKMADRITNLYSPAFYWTNQKKIDYIIEAKLIYSELHTANKYLADRLLQKISDYSKYISHQILIN